MSVVATDSSTVVVSWNPAFSEMCDVFARNYTVRYQLSGGNGSYNKVNILGTSVTLRVLEPNAQYGVEVAAISSNGAAISDFSAMVQFTVPPTATKGPSKLLLPATVIK